MQYTTSGTSIKIHMGTETTPPLINIRSLRTRAIKLGVGAPLSSTSTLGRVVAPGVAAVQDDTNGYYINFSLHEDADFTNIRPSLRRLLTQQ